MAFVDATINNQNNAPIPANPLGAESFMASRSGAMAGSSGDEIVYETTRPAVLEIFEVGSNTPSAPRARVYALTKTGGWELVPLVVKADGSALDGITPYTVRLHKPGAFDLVVDDSSTASYKFVLTRPLAFPLGLRIAVGNVTTTEKNIAVAVYGRLLK